MHYGIPFINRSLISKYGEYFEPVNDNDIGGLTKLETKLTEEGDLALDGFIIASRYENMLQTPYGGVKINV